MSAQDTPQGIDTATQLCAVIGNPVGHSLSPAIHNAGFRALGLNYVYLAFEVTDLEGFLRGMRAMPNFRGASVTIPHKEAIIPFLDEIDPVARGVGSVNTVTHADGRLAGATTDGPGTLRAFAEAGVDLAGKRVLFLGAGGAARAVAFEMAERAGVAGITLLARRAAQAERLAADIAAAGTTAQVVSGTLEAGLEAAVATHDILVQGTPVGMYPHAEGETVVPAAWLRASQVVFDMVYRPQRTRLIREATAAGCTCIPGLEMLLHQAAEQFERWTGQAAPLTVMRDALVGALGE